MSKRVRLAPIAVLVAGALVAACSSSGGGGSDTTPDEGITPEDASGRADVGDMADGADATLDAPGVDAPGADSAADAGASDGSGGGAGDASEVGAGNEAASGDSAVDTGAGASDAAPDGTSASDGGPTDSSASDSTTGDGSSIADSAVDGPDAAVEAGPCADSDGDGYGVGSGCLELDCDDTNPFVNPGMLELADDGLDNDCSGSALTAAAGPGFYVDAANASCSDTDPARGSKSVPYCTLAKANADAQSASTPRNIFVAKGSYPLGFITGAGKTTNVFGGYDSAAWTYDPAANVTTIGGQDTVQAAGGLALTAWVTWQGTGVLQGFHINGGAFGTDAGVNNFFTVDIGTGARATLAYDTLVGGSAKGTIAVEVRTSASAFLFENTITGGTATTSGAYGVNALGNATLFGNRVDCASGTAVQNFGNMLLVANVLNGAGSAANVAQTAGLNNFSSSGGGTAMLVGNVIFGGRGLSSSYGVQSSGAITLVDNVLGGRGPSATAGGSADNVSFFSFSTGTATLVNNDFYTPLTSGTSHAVYASTGDAGAFQYYSGAAAVDTCAFNGCQLAQGTIVADPAFSSPSTGDFHIPGVSPCHDGGADPSQWIAAGLARRDIDLEGRPQGAWDIGADEIP